jgi:FdhE protein
MAQRILEPGQIETLASRSIPRIRLPDRTHLFSRRAARLRKLASTAAIGDYLQFIAALVDAQHAAMGRLALPPASVAAPSDAAAPLDAAASPDAAAPPDTAGLASPSGRRMPPLHPSIWPRAPHWRNTLEQLCEALAGPSFPPGVGATIVKLRRATPAWIEAQADAVLATLAQGVDMAAAPFVMAALQVHWGAASSGLRADEIKALDMPGVCPVCGTLPVASLVCANSPYQGYRYLHCALCATEWHMVRVQCSQCGASGKSIGYHSLERAAPDEDASAEDLPATRAETCEECRGYRKILYQEKDPGVEPVADDLASLGLDLLLGREGYTRASGNPLLWQAA